MGLEEYIRDYAGLWSPPDTREWDQWVSASRTRNWCLRNPLQDWLERHGETAGFERDLAPDPRTDFREFIFAKGQAFETAVLALLEERVPVYRIQGFEQPTLSMEACQKTFDAMARAEPVIAQGVLWNPQNQTYGAADLLVRSDVLISLFPGCIPNDEVSLGAPGLGLARFHYRVVDIKYTTLKLDKRGNAKSEHLPYMVQAVLYNEALGRIQEYTPPQAYLLGRSWSGVAGEECRSCMDRLAVVPRDWCGRSGSLEEVAHAATAWIRRVRLEGNRWHPVTGPTLPELRPNLSAVDSPWTNATKLIANEMADPTLAWQVGCDGRERAAAGGIARWDDPRFTSASVGLNGSRAVILDTLLDLTRQSGTALVWPARIKTERDLWGAPGGVEFYVDFETVSDVHDDFASLPWRAGRPMIYMIGCGHVEGGEWQLTWFVADRLEPECVAEVIEAWLDHIEVVRQRLAPGVAEPMVFHWSPAESSGLTNGLKSARSRHPERSRRWKEPNWYDFLGRVVRVEPVVVKGPMGFGLKNVAKSLKQHGLIATAWEDNITDGLGAMVGAWSCYDEASRTGAAVQDLELMGAIRHYNEVDCKVMMEVVGYLRASH